MPDVFCVGLAPCRYCVLIARWTGDSMGDKIKDKVGGMFSKGSSRGNNDDY